MIVRIVGEDEYDVPDDALERLNPGGHAVILAIRAADEEAFGRPWPTCTPASTSLGTLPPVETFS